MEVGDLVLHNGKQAGVIIHLWGVEPEIASVLFEDGEYDVDCDDLEVINGSR